MPLWSCSAQHRHALIIMLSAKNVDYNEIFPLYSRCMYAMNTPCAFLLTV